jgi:hypothetical protein
MVGLVFYPALAALMIQGNPGTEFPALPVVALAADSAALAGAIHGQQLELALRGAGFAVRAEGEPTAGGCATRIAVSSPVSPDSWSRLLRWTDVAWTGALPDGRVMVAFYEQEGRLPGDRLAFAPSDPAAFQAALRRVSEACRFSAREGERVLSGDYPTSRSCYFARHPGLELVEAVGSNAAPDPTRAVVTMLAEETPEAELRLLVENGASDEGDGWARPDLAFTIAGLNHFRIGAVRFALDGQPVAAEHSIVLYGDTRLRIRMDPFGAASATDSSFYHRLASASRATIILLDTAGVSRAVLNFETGAPLAAARQAFEKADWSCTAAAPAPTPAALWQIAP